MQINSLVSSVGVRPERAAARISTVIAEQDVTTRKLYWSLFFACLVIVSAPIWATEYPPLLDYPNHLARAFVIRHYDDNPYYRGEYDKLIEPVPNMAIDLIVPPLMRWFEIRTAGKIFLTLMIVLFATGCHMFGTAVHGRPSWFALSFVFLTLNQTVFWGFVNYFFGVGTFLVGISLWLRYRHRWNWWRWVLVTFMFWAGYITHLSAYAFFVVAVTVITGFELIKLRRLTGSMLLGLAPLVPPFLTFVIFMLGTGEKGDLVWAGPSAKFFNLASWPIGYHYLIDCGLVAIVLLAMGWMLWRARGVSVKRPIFVVGGVFWVLYLLCPLAIFTSYSADIRFVIPAIVFTVLSIRCEMDRRLGAAVLAVFVLASIIRVGSVWEAWRRLDQKTAAQIALFDHFEDGARVYPITFFPPDKEGSKNERPIHHAIHYATIYHHTFSPTFFAYRGQQPVLYKSRPRYTKITQRKPPEAVDWSFIFAKHDYIWGYQLDEQYRRFLTERCDVVAEQDGGLILRIRKPSVGSQFALKHFALN